MKRAEKLQVVEELVEKFSIFDCFYVVDAMGLTVAQVNNFRKSCVAHNLQYHVVKNTLIQKALERFEKGAEYAEFFSKVLKGFSGILFARENGSAPAKVLKQFMAAQRLSLPVLKGASVDGEVFIGSTHLEELSKLKTKHEMMADIIAMLNMPIRQVIAALQSGERSLAGMVTALSNSPA